MDTKSICTNVLKRRFGWLEICLVGALVALIAQVPPEIVRAICSRPRPGHQVSASADLKVGDLSTEIQYLVYLPVDYSSNIKWPLLLFLHGSGQLGDDLELVAKCGPPELLANGKQLPMIVISPQCRTGRQWESNQLLALLDHLEQHFSVDPDRVYISGQSMGGYGTWTLAAVAPERFAAAIPVCGGGNLEDAKRLVNLPIWAFHGAMDEVVPLERSQQMVDAIEKLGGNATLTIYPDKGHGICDLTFSRDDLYQWLLAQHRANQ